MEDEPFIMKSVDRAREWVDAFAKTTKTDKEESANVLAALCRFGSWNVMAYAIESLPPTACDEKVGEKALNERVEGYMHVLVCMMNFRPPIAALFIKRLSPSANYPFTDFKIDEALNEMAKDLEQGLPEDGDQITDDVLKTAPDPIRMLTAIRLAGQVNLSGWLTSLDYLGWDIDMESVDEEADVGEPSFEVIDDDIGPVPVYLCSLTRVPEDDGDPAINLFMKACLGDFIQEIDCGAENEAMLILWRWPQHKEVAGNHYCCIGARYSNEEGAWQDVLVSEACDTPSRLLELNNEAGPINEVGVSWQSEELIDENKNLSGIIAVLLSGYSPTEEPSGGWNLLREEIEGTGWGRLSVAAWPTATVH